MLAIRIDQLYTEIQGYRNQGHRESQLDLQAIPHRDQQQQFALAIQVFSEVYNFFSFSLSRNFTRRERNVQEKRIFVRIFMKNVTFSLFLSRASCKMSRSFTRDTR